MNPDIVHNPSKSTALSGRKNSNINVKFSKNFQSSIKGDKTLSEKREDVSDSQKIDPVLLLKDKQPTEESKRSIYSQNADKKTHKLPINSMYTRRTPSNISSQRKVTKGNSSTNTNLSRVSATSKKKESESDCSNDLTKVSSFNKDANDHRSTTSHEQLSKEKPYDFKQNYISENNRKSGTIDKEEERSTELVKTKPKTEVIEQPVSNKYFSAYTSIKPKGSVIEKNNIPLIKGETSKRKKLNSVRLSQHPNNQLSSIVDNNRVAPKPKTQKDSLSNRRTPSVIKTSQEADDISFENKRSKSESCAVEKMSNTPYTNIKDIVSFIQSREDKIPRFETAKTSVKKYGVIEAFVVNTHKGTVRHGNEDRVSILLNAQNKFMKPKNGSKSMYVCSMFSVFDGHGGTDCCNYLKENLHNRILAQLDVEGLIVPALKRVYKELDSDYLKHALSLERKFSGSCAITLLVINSALLVVNTGDSRAIISARGGTSITEASADHKPDKLSEFHRIIESGGELYRMSSNPKTGQSNMYFANNYAQMKNINEYKKNSPNVMFGPWRINPGGLSVSRAFGDPESKLSSKGETRGVVTSEPDITEFETFGIDFVFLACKLTSRWNLR